MKNQEQLAAEVARLRGMLVEIETDIDAQYIQADNDGWLDTDEIDHLESLLEQTEVFYWQAVEAETEALLTGLENELGGVY